MSTFRDAVVLSAAKQAVVLSAAKDLAFALVVVATHSAPLAAQQPAPGPQGPQWLNADTSKKTNQSNFRMLEEFPSPNEYRTGSGSPGPKYWQQQVDYTVKTSLDTTNHKVTGSERITYHNNAPVVLG